MFLGCLLQSIRYKGLPREGHRCFLQCEVFQAVLLNGKAFRVIPNKEYT